jgi:DNA-3-methyladenine glycosylase II
LPDQEVIRRLTEVKGIGAWTVQDALLIALQRPDVVRTDDLPCATRSRRATASITSLRLLTWWVSA